MWLMSKAVISTYPKHLRQMAGLNQGPLLDAAVRLPNKLIPQRARPFDQRQTPDVRSARTARPSRWPHRCCWASPPVTPSR